MNIVTYSVTKTSDFFSTANSVNMKSLIHDYRILIFAKKTKGFVKVNEYSLYFYSTLVKHGLMTLGGSAYICGVVFA